MAEDGKACPFCGEVATGPTEERALLLKKEITRLTEKIDELLGRGVPQKAIAVLDDQREEHITELNALIAGKNSKAETNAS
jgi:DNA repair exonuclease SbcCD ATPase subunit